jgi:hypothetical protein
MLSSEKNRKGMDHDIDDNLVHSSPPLQSTMFVAFYKNAWSKRKEGIRNLNICLDSWFRLQVGGQIVMLCNIYESKFDV